MSISMPDRPIPGTTVTADEVFQLAAKYGLSLSDVEVQDFTVLLSGLNHYAKAMMVSPDYFPAVDHDLYPRTDIHRPEGEAREQGAWACKATVKAMTPRTSTLQHRTVALKDNIALAGVPCTNGSAAIDWIPNIDATVATRVLDAGATILGKAACESSCLGSVSDTSVTGPVQNPYAEGYNCGGSSSGCGRLVGTGSVDLAIGCDQGGSIRMPAANCGIVGLKPTWGLVPYTGIISLESTLDHVGPMAKSVLDCAKLLEVIAGADGIDDRQPHNYLPGTVRYVDALEQQLAVQEQQLLKDIKIGVLEEGFQDPLTDPNVASVCRSAIKGLETLGGEVKSVSVPLHQDSGILWQMICPISGTQEGLLGAPHGRKQLLFPERAEKMGPQLSQRAFDALGPGGQNIYLRGLFLRDNYGPGLHARCTNLVRKLTEAYDTTFLDCDVLVMPTIVFPPVKLRTPGTYLGPLQALSRATSMTKNTASFNLTGHPALSLPVGFVPAQDNAAVKLPTGLQIVGTKFEDLLCLKVAAAWEKAYDWKKCSNDTSSPAQK